MMIGYARWIWGSREITVKDSYYVFRKSFAARQGQAVMLQISADTTFAVFINGARMPLTQFSDYPTDKTYSEADIGGLLKDGENTVMISVHFLGEPFLTSRPGRPCLKAVIFDGSEILAATGSDWRAVPDPNYRSGGECKVSPQLGYTFEYDARPGMPAETAWREVYVYPDQEWWKPAKARPTPEPDELDPPAVELCQHGWLRRVDFAAVAAVACATDYTRPAPREELFAAVPPCRSGDSYVRTAVELRPDRSDEAVFRPLPPDGAADGYYLIADLKRETVGWPVFAVSAPAGTVIDIAHGEHLDDGRCRAAPGGRNFGDRYICREGNNEFIHAHRRIGARYVELHITGFGGGEVRVRYAGIVPLRLPLPEAAEFRTEDGLLARINRVAVDTLELCMHEHYEDCPWREQALYAYDSRNQIHYGYYVWGNYDFAAASLDLLAGSYRGNGYLNLTAPGFHQKSIPAFTFSWIAELREHWLFSGSNELFIRHLKLVDEILELALARRDTVDGLYHSAVPGFDGVWNFYEWRGQLAGIDEFPQSPYNICLLEALRAAAAMQRWAGNEQRAAEFETHAAMIGKVCEEKFFDPSLGFYRTTLTGDCEPCELVQIQMLYHGLVPERKIGKLLKTIFSGRLRKLTYGSLFYMLNAMMNAGPEARAYADNFLMAEFAGPVLSGATSLWETEFGSRDFDGAGSLCHAWSSVMPYYSGAYLLGVKPLEPGFKTFELKIYPGHLTHASGTVPTPHGAIRVAWQMRKDRSLDVEVLAPATLKMTAAQYDEFPIQSISDCRRA